MVYSFGMIAVAMPCCSAASAVTGPIERALTVETARADREANMWAFTRAALDLLEACIKEAEAQAQR